MTQDSIQQITLVGCGNVGSRHLQALAKLQDDLLVDIVEPSEEACKLAKSRLGEIPYDKTTKKFVWHKSINELKNGSDLVIEATHSIGRVDRLMHMLEMNHSRFLVEKMVCQSSKEYEMLLAKMEAAHIKGWVNVPRRYFESYKKIKENLGDSGMVHLSVTSGNEGLGTNAIHYIDLFSWFSADYKVRLKGELLFDKLFPNKRGKELKEFAGTITGSSQNGSVLTITFLPYYGLPFTVSIVNKDNHFVVDESNERIFVIKGTEDSKSLEFRTDYVSNTTTKIVTDILQRDDCLLPSLADSSRAHHELFRVFNAHIKKLTNEEPLLCPIT